MRRLAPCLSLLLLAGCGQEAPKPVPLGERKTVVNPPRAPDPTPQSPFRHPDTEPPPAREAPQVDAEALARILGAAEAARAAGDPDGAIRELRECANKVPQSGRCEALLGMLLTAYPHRRAEYRYFLGEAARSDDPSVVDPLARELAEALLGQAMFEEAVLVHQRRIAQGAAAAADHAALSRALQGIAGREGEAADALAKAFAADPSQTQWLHDEAVLRGQIPGEARRAADLFREFLTRSAGDPAVTARVEYRIRELEAMAASPGEAKPSGR